jgi:hypothetical protein
MELTNGIDMTLHQFAVSWTMLHFDDIFITLFSWIKYQNSLSSLTEVTVVL